MTNKKKFLALVSEEKTTTVHKNKERIGKRAMLRESQRISLKILRKLDELGWSQKDLAAAMNVSPQHITKLVSGKENLTIETQIKIQEILDIPILASYYENRPDDLQQGVLRFTDQSEFKTYGQKAVSELLGLQNSIRLRKKNKSLESTPYSMAV